METVIGKAQENERRFYEIYLNSHVDMFIILSGNVFIEKIESNTVENLLRSLQKEKEECVEENGENKFHEKYA